MNVILRGIVGSQAHGLATPESDTDYAGVFVEPTRDVLGLSGYNRSQVSTGDNDETLHEIGKFIFLALKANPTVLELLWIDTPYVALTEEGQWLLDLRKAFLSNRVRSTYIGFCNAQIGRLLRRNDGSFSSTTRKRTDKHARHATRLMISAEELVQTGRLRVRMNPTEAAYCHRMGAFAIEDPQGFASMMEEAIVRVLALPSVLPPVPDFEATNEVLLAIRERHWSRAA